MNEQRSHQWLAKAFLQAMRGIGATASDADLLMEANRLISDWSEPSRTFHNLDYLVNMLNRIDEVDNLSHNPDILRIAAWYHLAVFIPDRDTLSGERHTCCLASADLAQRQLNAFGVEPDVVNDVIAMIMHQTSDHADDADTQTFQDVALSYLGAIPQDFKESAKQIRQEYGDLSEEDYCVARRQALLRILNRSSIYHTPFSDDLEGLARQNLERECHQLEQTLKDNPALLEQTVPHKETPPVEDSSAIVIKARTRSGAIAVQRNKPDDDEPPTPVLGVPVIRHDDDLSDDDDDEEYASTLESAVDFMAELETKPTSGSTPVVDKESDEDDDHNYPAIDPDEAEIYGDHDPEDDTLI